MKKIFILLFLIIFLFFTALLYSTENIDAVSKITQVIIYPEWAYVTKKTNINLQKGLTRIYFKNLPSWIDPESIQVKINPINDFKIIQTLVNPVYLTQISEKDVLKVKDRITQLKDLLQDINSEIDVIKKEREYLTSLLNWSVDKNKNDKEDAKIDIKNVQDLNIFLKNALNENLKKENELVRKIRDITPEIEILNKKWAEMEIKATLEQKEIIVEIESLNGGQLDIFVGYLISGASWYPVYDARISGDSKNVDIEYSAIVQQSTGEDWSDAQFRLSTIRPFLVRELPELNPWYADSSNYNKNPNEKFSRSKNEGYDQELKNIQKKQKDYIINESNVEQQKAFEEYEQSNIKFNDVIQQAEERGTTAEFNIQGNYNVKTDGKSVKMIINKNTFESEKQYSAIPVISRNTYVTGIIKNNYELPFLPGVVNVYKNGNFLGKSKINFVAEKEKFSLFMGLEERIKTTRILDIKKSSSSILGLKKILKVGYVIEVQNFTNETISVDLSDQIPVSQNDQVKIKINNIDPKIDKNDKGILTWNLKLAPNEKKALYFEFEIEYPKDYSLKNTKEIEREIFNKME